jgi:hypothetical protein
MKVVAVLLITLSVAFAQDLEAEAFVSERDVNSGLGWNENSKPSVRDVMSGE